MGCKCCGEKSDRVRGAENNKCWQEWRGRKMVQLLWKMEWWVHKKAEHRLPWNVALPLVGVYLKESKTRELSRYLYSLVDSSLIRSSQKVKTPQMSLDGWMDKQSLYRCSRILFNLKKEGSSDPCYSVGITWRHDALMNWARPKRTHNYMILLIWGT